jgi:hypothetical protein
MIEETVTQDFRFEKNDRVKLHPDAEGHRLDFGVIYRVVTSVPVVLDNPTPQEKEEMEMVRWLKVHKPGARKPSGWILSTMFVRAE